MQDHLLIVGNQSVADFTGKTYEMNFDCNKKLIELRTVFFNFFQFFYSLRFSFIKGINAEINAVL